MSYHKGVCSFCGREITTSAYETTFCSRWCRFWSKVRIGTIEECWKWHGPKNTAGYGTCWFSGKTTYAHRTSWAIIFGQVPSYQCVLHRCDNRACVNPAHLEIGTYKDNFRDMVAKGREQNYTKLELVSAQLREALSEIDRLKAELQIAYIGTKVYEK